MYIMELGAIGEFVGAIAVLVTLIYLAMQVRQSNRLAKAESARAATRDYINTMGWMDPSLFRHGIADFESLSKDDQMGMHNWLAAFFWIGQNEFALSRLELVDETQTQTNLQILASLIQTPEGAHWWSNAGHFIFTPNFQNYLEDLAGRTAGGPGLVEAMPWLRSDEAEA